MENLTTLLKQLIAELESVPAEKRGLEKQILSRTTALLRALEAGNRETLADQRAGLHHFWLQSVPWCSQWSKALEKILIAYDDQNP